MNAWKPVELKYKYKGLDGKKRNRKVKEAMIKAMQPDYSDVIDFRNLQRNSPNVQADIIPVQLDSKANLPSTALGYTLKSRPGKRKKHIAP